MTTAARPTWDPARGNDSKAPSFQYSSRDLAAHTKLKFRQPGQGTTDEIGDRERLIAELRSAEQEYYENKDKEGDERQDQKMIGGPSADEVDARRQQLMEEAEKMAQLDKDASDSESDSGGSSSDESDESDDDEDNTAELLATLQKIRRERAEEKERQERERLEQEEAEREEEAMTGNPLLNIGDEKRDFSVKRRWDDDVIFKNQARGTEDRSKKRFVNDMLRSDFHRRFLTKYIH
ncbi:Cwf15/Cwc15 cell cycle control protein [Lichtheimia hyalospora FSU 10163]|nr:Cwf15/Cwc15 cell cycle control protein [Lichtheimia hyalospora FSU 10163]